MKAISSQTYTTVLKAIYNQMEAIEMMAEIEGSDAMAILELEDLQAAIEDINECLGIK